MATKTNSAVVFIDDLLLKHSISLRTVYDFAAQHKEELQRVEEIFDMRSERDQKLCLSLFRLLAEKKAKKMSAYYCRKYQIENSLDNDFFNENKLFLITAFIQNPAFFSISWNLCGIIQTRLALLKEAPVPSKQPATEKQAVEEVMFENWGFVFADGSGPLLKPIFSEAIDRNGIKGTVKIKANNENESGMVQFFFTFDEYSPVPPYFPVIRFSTTDGKSHSVKLYIYDAYERSKELVIQSELQRGIKYSGGFTNVSITKEPNA